MLRQVEDGEGNQGGLGEYEGLQPMRGARSLRKDHWCRCCKMRNRSVKMQTPSNKRALHPLTRRVIGDRSTESALILLGASLQINQSPSLGLPVACWAVSRACGHTFKRTHEKPGEKLPWGIQHLLRLLKRAVGRMTWNIRSGGYPRTPIGGFSK
jgi:hypothetical protein